MVVFRVIEKVGANRWFGDGWLLYIVTVVAVIGGATVLAVVMQKITNKVMEIMNKRTLAV